MATDHVYILFCLSEIVNNKKLAFEEGSTWIVKASKFPVGIFRVA